MCLGIGFVVVVQNIVGLPISPGNLFLLGFVRIDMDFKLIRYRLGSVTNFIQIIKNFEGSLNVVVFEFCR